jgi:hypothetical protein
MKITSFQGAMPAPEGGGYAQNMRVGIFLKFFLVFTIDFASP